MIDNYTVAYTKRFNPNIFLNDGHFCESPVIEARLKKVAKILLAKRMEQRVLSHIS